MLFLLSLRFRQISPLVILPRPRIGMLSLVTVSPVITAFHSCCLSHHVFDQVNHWPSWVGIETAIFWQCSPGTLETERLYPLRQGPRRAIQDGFLGPINPIICSPYLVFHSRVHTEFVIVFNWNHFEMRFLNLRMNFFKFFIYCGLFVLILVVFVLFLLSLNDFVIYSPSRS